MEKQIYANMYTASNIYYTLASTYRLPAEGHCAGPSEHGMEEAVQGEDSTAHEGEEEHTAAPGLVGRPPLGEAAHGGKRY